MTAQGRCIETLAHGRALFFRFVASRLANFPTEKAPRKSRAIPAPHQGFRPAGPRATADSTECSRGGPLFRMIHEGPMRSPLAIRAEKRTKRLMGAPLECLNR